MAEKKQKKIVAKKAGKPAVKKTAVKKMAKKVAPKKAASKVTTKKTAVKKVALKKPAKKKVTKSAKPVKKTSSKKAKNDEECFLTTACVSYYALADNAYELMTLRTFRDNYMLKSEKGRMLVKQYYNVAPLIVSTIQKDKEHTSVYRFIYNSIQKACGEIEQKKFGIAQQTYTTLVNRLLKKYAISIDSGE